MPSEFDIIEYFLNQNIIQRDDVALGIGDDAALINIPPDQQLAITTDTLIAGVHFPQTTAAYDIGFKSLAVNLSDLAAMGATPCWILLALTLPSLDQPWLQKFCDGFFDLAKKHRTQLIGGDLTRGPLSMTITALGLTPQHQTITRKNAKPGDHIYVTSCLGDAALGLHCLESSLCLPDIYKNNILEKLNRPRPRVEIGIRLRNIANAAIDISDGFIADLTHILKASHVGAEIHIDNIPLSKAMSFIDKEEALRLALTGGDDYELCFTVPPDKLDLLEQALPSIEFDYTCVGKITETQSLFLYDQHHEQYAGHQQGYDHFR